MCVAWCVHVYFVVLFEVVLVMLYMYCAHNVIYPQVHTNVLCAFTTCVYATGVVHHAHTCTHTNTKVFFTSVSPSIVHWSFPPPIKG